MAFLVRKLNKIDAISSLCGKANIEQIDADIPTTEFRTKNGLLSTWYIESLEDIGDAVLAIAVSSSEITKMDFIIIDTSILSANALEYKQTYAGIELAIPDLQNTHYDILNVSIQKLVNCTKVYQTVAEMDPDFETYIVRFTAGEIRDFLKNAVVQKRVDESKAKKKIQEEIIKISKSTS